MSKNKLIPRCYYGTNRGGLVHHDRITPGTWGNRGLGNELESALERGLSSIGKGAMWLLQLPDHIQDGANWLLGAIPGGPTSEQLVHNGRAKREAGSGGLWEDYQGNVHVNPTYAVLPDWLLPSPSGANKVKITVDNLADITDEMWDAAYNAAIANKDLVEAQRLRDLHFKAKAPNTKVVDSNGNPLPVYHGSPNTFNTFEEKYQRNGQLSYGFYFTPNKTLAERYANNDEGELYKVYLDLKTLDLAPKTRYDDWVFNDGFYSKQSYEPVEAALLIVVRRPLQIKLTSTVTHDDLGNIIPLSKRDNFSNPDVRYSWLLPIGLTTTFGLPYLVNLNDYK